MPGGGSMSRVVWLGRPWVLVSALTLVANDHVFKRRWPGWWTGKLSDAAGVVVVGVLLAVLVGRRPGLITAAVGFTALKTVPGVAEAAAPVLGGVTLRDATDLVGLLALVPVNRDLGRPFLERNSTGDELRRPLVPVHRRARLRALSSAALPVLTAVVALTGTTATSCLPDPAVVQVRNDGASILARVTTNRSDASYGDHWMVSVDDGLTWRPAEDPAGWIEADAATERMRATAAPSIACGIDRCIRVLDHRAIQSAVPGTWDWRNDWWLTPDGVEDASTGCSAGDRGILTSITAVERRSPDDPDRFAVSLGAGGVLLQSDDGSWTAATLPFSVDAEPADGGDVVVVVIGWSVVALLVGWLPPGRRPRQVALRTGIMVGGVVGAVASMVAISFGGQSVRSLVIAGGVGLAAGYVLLRIIEQTSAVEQSDHGSALPPPPASAPRPTEG